MVDLEAVVTIATGLLVAVFVPYGIIYFLDSVGKAYDSGAGGALRVQRRLGHGDRWPASTHLVEQREGARVGGLIQAEEKATQ